MAKLKGFGDDVQVLWQDKKRYFGLPLSFTNYALICKPGLYTKIVRITGFLSTHIEEVHAYRVDDISCNQSIGARILGVGTIDIYVNDASCQVLKLQSIKNPLKVKQLINDTVETERTMRGMRYAEMA